MKWCPQTIGTIRKVSDRMSRMPGMSMWGGGDDLRWLVDQINHRDTRDTKKQKASCCPGSAPCLVDFDTFAVVASVARDSLCGSGPKVLAQFGLWTTKNFQNRWLSKNLTKKDHATLATVAKDATESPRTFFKRGASFIKPTSPPPTSRL